MNWFCLLIDGEYHFVNLEDKVHKHAPKSWKSSAGEVSHELGKYMYQQNTMLHWFGFAHTSL